MKSSLKKWPKGNDRVYIFFPPQGKTSYIFPCEEKQVAKNIYMTPWVKFTSVKTKQG